MKTKIMYQVSKTGKLMLYINGKSYHIEKDDTLIIDTDDITVPQTQDISEFDYGLSMSPKKKITLYQFLVDSSHVGIIDIMRILLVSREEAADIIARGMSHGLFIKRHTQWCVRSDMKQKLKELYTIYKMQVFRDDEEQPDNNPPKNALDTASQSRYRARQNPNKNANK